MKSKPEQQASRFAALSVRDGLSPRTPRVWLLEDSALQAEQTKRALDAYDVRHFTDGGSLLEHLSEGAPDVLILDWQLPGISGPAVLSFARERFDEVTLPILVLTSDEGVILEALVNGANDFVTKPFVEVVLRARVATLARVQALSARTRAAEQQRTDALERVYEAETRMHIALEAAEIGTWELDPRTHVLDLDGTSQAVLGLAAKVQLAAAESGIHPDDRALFRAALAASLDPQLRAPFSVECRLARPDGVETWAALWAVPFFEGDQPVRLVGAVLDDTERKRATLVMERDGAFRERFIAILAHDLRTPLSSLRLGSALLSRPGVTPEVAKDLGGRIEATAIRMERMINDLLDFTRSRQGGGMPIVLVDADLEPICRSVVQEVQMSVPGRLIAFESRGDTRCRCDAGRLQQVVSNLVSNAVDYSPESSVVLVRLRAGERALTLEVQNEGRVIPEATLRALFDPFRRGASESTSSRGSRGLGLGLYIVEQIAVAHGGSVAARSDEESGTTTFSVTIPRPASAAVTRAAASPGA
ncbi:MAG: ATP-binding protein [Polyangiales bacterium]